MSTKGTVIVTGSSRGIGRAIALRLAQEGYDLVVHGRAHSDALAQIADEIRALGRDVRVLAFDVAQREVAREALESDVETHGAYYGLVCNAGVTADAAFPAMSGADP